MAMLDLINYPDVNPDRIVHVKDRFDSIRLKNKKIGTVFIASTVGDMDKSGDFKELWK